VAAQWDAISQRDAGETVPASGAAQGTNEVTQAMRARHAG
jgi:hypothetical protein